MVWLTSQVRFAVKALQNLGPFFFSTQGRLDNLWCGG
jgi:hypothetical protein